MNPDACTPCHAVRLVCGAERAPFAPPTPCTQSSCGTRRGRWRRGSAAGLRPGRRRARHAPRSDSSSPLTSVHGVRPASQMPCKTRGGRWVAVTVAAAPGRMSAAPGAPRMQGPPALTLEPPPPPLCRRRCCLPWPPASGGAVLLGWPRCIEAAQPAWRPAAGLPRRCSGAGSRQSLQGAAWNTGTRCPLRLGSSAVAWEARWRRAEGVQPCGTTVLAWLAVFLGCRPALQQRH